VNIHIGDEWWKTSEIHAWLEVDQIQTSELALLALIVGRSYSVIREEHAGVRAPILLALSLVARNNSSK